MTILSKCINSVQKVGLGLLVTVYDSLSRVLRELTVFDDELMQIVSQEVGASVATVTVKNAKEAAFRPFLNVFLDRRLHDVQDNADSVLVVVSNDALVGIRSIAHDETIFADTTFGGLPTRQVECCWIWWRSVTE